jgi:hypothetical protein
MVLRTAVGCLWTETDYFARRTEEGKAERGMGRFARGLGRHGGWKGATELLGQVRSQTEFGNEENFLESR